MNRRRLPRLAWAALLLPVVLLLSQAQPTPPPTAPGPPPAQTQPTPPAAPPAATPATPPASTPATPPAAAPAPDATAPAAIPDDPFEGYQSGLKVKISQLETGAFPVVRAFVSVVNPNGTQLKKLLPEHFSVQENGTDAGEIRFASRVDLDLPLSIILIVDVSGSMEPSIELEKEAVRAFTAQLSDRDRVGLITFSDAALPQVPLGTDRTTVQQRIDEMTAFGQTALWDAIYRGMEQLYSDPTPARRALVVLSDGLDNKSYETPETILQYFDETALKQNKGFSIYTLGLGEEIDRMNLDAIAEHTGGQYIDSPTAEDLARVYQDILSQIQNEYLLEYDSPVTTTPGQIIDVTIGLNGVTGFEPGKYTYRSPGLSKALARALWPGLIVISILLIILIMATIYKLSRRAWLTLQITPLEGKDYALGTAGASIGTQEVNSIRVRQDPAMLDCHATLHETADGYMLAAVDPQSPIIMDGRLLAKKLLRHGDRFTVGTTQFVFHERVMRPGDGQALDAEFYTSAPVEPLTEAAQAAGSVDAVKRRAPAAVTATSGPHAGQHFNLQQGENVIGRSEGQIVLSADSQVSRRHCCITLNLGGATVIDTGSTNGTRINGAPLQPGMALPVYAGDELGVGTGVYRLE